MSASTQHTPTEILATVDDGFLRIGTAAHPDWFGPSPGPVEDGRVRRTLQRFDGGSVIVCRSEALVDLDATSTGAYDQPSMPWPVFTPAERLPGGSPEGMRALAYQHCEFGLPSTSGDTFDGFFLLPHRPPTGWPLLATAPDGTTILVAPLDAFHDQVVGLNGGTIRCGWNGDIDRVPAGFRTDLAFVLAKTARAAITRWGAMLMERAGTVRPDPWSDSLGSRPSYWTDNGAAYWYRTEPGHDAAGSIVAAVEDLRERGVPIGTVQLDSWFYPHVDLRPFDTDEWVVPPSAMVAWEPRPDVLPEGIPALRERLGNPPLAAHIRHLSSAAPIAAEVPVFVDGPYAVPSTGEGYERWLDSCVEWGVETFEHDWLVEVFFGVRGLREEPGRARAWQEGIDRAAGERGITLQWCMATPADFAQTTTLSNVTSIRTCGDHGYIATAGQLWAWFCTTNALARSLGLAPFKDVFRADPEVAGDNGEPEALLSALSTGPVGLGDRVGRFDPGLALRTCRADGTLVKPDVPITATSATLLAAPAFVPAAMVAEARTEHASLGTHTTYLFVAHCAASDERIVAEVPLDSLDDSTPTGEVIAWDWRAGTATRLAADASIHVDLGREEWTYHVLAPILSDGIAVIGDVTRFATVGRPLIEVVEDADSLRVEVESPGETITITGWSERSISSPGAEIRRDDTSGIWAVTLQVPAVGPGVSGRVVVRLRHD
ncbi:MAG: hypothetical protein KDB02_12920 [Acidimicrobiales bacterium]|nr:hypothetical protein [Acidimicrobiales bacterium]